MAYTPINWQTGDTITAEKLNKMDNGWGYGSTQLFSETVTTEVDPEYPDDPAAAQIAYSGTIDADTITVTFDNTEYECSRIDSNGSYFYGGFSTSGPDFTNYPFFIFSGHINQLVTQTAGEHTVAASVSSLQTSADFAAAVSMVSDSVLASVPLRCVEGVTSIIEAKNALNNGRLVYFTAPEDSYEGASVHGFLISLADITCTIVPTSTKIAAKFSRDGGLFYIEHLSS